MAGKRSSITTSRQWMWFVIGAGVVTYGFLILMDVPLFFLLYTAYLCFILPLGLINKFFRIMTVIIPLVEVGVCVCIAATGLKNNSYFWGGVFIDLVLAAGLSLFTLLAGRVIDLVDKSSKNIKYTAKWDKTAAQQELVEYIGGRIAILSKNVLKSEMVFRLEADTYTGELLLKYSKGNNEYKFDSYIICGKNLQLFLESYYFYSVGNFKRGKREIISELKDIYTEVWTEILNNCEKELREILAIKYPDNKIRFEIDIS